MDAGELVEEEGPELNVLLVPPSMNESGARAFEESPPAALGDGVPLVDVGRREKVLMARTVQSSSISSDVK